MQDVGVVEEGLARKIPGKDNVSREFGRIGLPGVGLHFETPTVNTAANPASANFIPIPFNLRSAHIPYSSAKNVHCVRCSFLSKYSNATSRLSYGENLNTVGLLHHDEKQTW